MRRRFFACLLALASLCASPHRGTAQAERHGFDLKRDTFAFANDTAFAYGFDEQGRLTMAWKKEQPEFAHGCFLMVRAILQFQRFARFEPAQPKLTRAEYCTKLRALFGTPVWWPAREPRIVFPGFADLHSFSKAYEGLLKETLGNWFFSYCRPGNFRMMLGHPRIGQQMTARWLTREIEAGRTPAIYIARFPQMNHAVIVFAAAPKSNGDTVFQVYDCNYPGEPAELRYVAARRSFDFVKRWYFGGGQVNAMRIYLSPLH